MHPPHPPICAPQAFPGPRQKLPLFVLKRSRAAVNLLIYRENKEIRSRSRSRGGETVEKWNLSTGYPVFTGNTARYIMENTQIHGGGGRKFRRSQVRWALENRLQTGEFGGVIHIGRPVGAAMRRESGENGAIIQNFRFSTAIAGRGNRWALWETEGGGDGGALWTNRLFHGKGIVENREIHGGIGGGRWKSGGCARRLGGFCGGNPRVVHGFIHNPPGLSTTC